MVNNLSKGKVAPEFKLVNTQDIEVKLSDYRGKQNVVLVFNRGFA